MARAGGELITEKVIIAAAISVVVAALGVLIQWMVGIQRQVDQAEADLDRYSWALQFYADPRHWSCTSPKSSPETAMDRGREARIALGWIRPDEDEVD